MDNSDSQILFGSNEGEQQINRFNLNKLKLILYNIWNPTEEEHLTADEFEPAHRKFIPAVATVWKVKMLVIAFNLFTCLVFTINFRNPSFILTALLTICIPFIDKYTWLRCIVNGFLTNELKYFDYFFIAFALHISIFLLWTAGILWNSIGWYLLLIDPKNYGLLLSFLIIFNSMLLTVYVILISILFFKIIQHVLLFRSKSNEAETNEFKRLINNEITDDLIEV